MKWYLSLCAAVLLLFATACDSLRLGQEKRLALADTYKVMLADGRISQEQYDALMAALNGNKTLLLERLLQSGLDIGLAMLGVRIWRGGINDRKGEVPVVPIVAPPSPSP